MASRTWNLKRLRGESNYWRARILTTAAHLDLFSWFGRRKKTPGALAAYFGGSREGWEIFLNALCGMGLMRKRGERYANAHFALRFLSCGGAPFLLPDYDDWKTWGRLAHLLTTGERPNIHLPFFSDIRKAGRLLHAIHLDSQKIAPYLIKKLSLSRCRTLLDVGGGFGTFSLAFCRHYPHLRATLVEHPYIAPLARRAVRDAGMAERVRVLGADFLRDPLPRGFNAVFLSNVLHGQGVRENRSLLIELYHCLNAKGQLILRDVFVSRDGTDPEWATLFSVLLLLHTPQGRCYRLDQLLGWLREAGFSRIQGPFRSSSLPFDPDSVLIAERD